MKRKFRIACIQNSAGSDPSKNLVRLEKLILQALRCKPDLIALPENFYWRGASRDLGKISAQTPGLIRYFKKASREKKVSFLLGSVLEKASKPNKYFSTSLLISQKGKVAARYRKIHLFGIRLRQLKTDESRHLEAGRQSVTGKNQGVVMGLSVCYDLRFPELYRQMISRGARILFVPANFTYVTGLAHWEVLLRARAIENQAFVVAPGQTGVHPSNKIKSFGTSLIIDPWGTVLAKASSGQEEVIGADLDFKRQSELRNRFPVLKHRVLKGVL